MTDSKRMDGWAGTVRGAPPAGATAERSRTTSIADIEAFAATGTVFLEVAWKFVKAVGVDARVEVATVRPDKPICTLKTSIVNGDGEVCLTGTATNYTVPLAPA